MFQNLLVKMRKIDERELEVDTDTEVNIRLVRPVMNQLKENTNVRGQKQMKRKKEGKIHHPKMRNINNKSKVEVEKKTEKRL